MLRKKVVKGLSKLDPAVKLGAKQVAQGKPGLLAAAFATRGGNSKAPKKPR
jgi:hypothetical protein